MHLPREHFKVLPRAARMDKRQHWFHAKLITKSSNPSFLVKSVIREKVPKQTNQALHFLSARKVVSFFFYAF